MAEDKSLTPEQQLLKLIEDPNKPGKAKAPAAAFAAPGRTKGIFGAILGRISFFKRISKKKTLKSRSSFSVASVNKLLYVAAGCLMVYVVFDAAASAMNLKRPPNFAPPKEMRMVSAKVPVEPLKETSYYLQKVSSRDIFKEGKKVVEAPVEGKADNSAAEANEVIQGLALVGISWSSNPDAIIEDKRSQRTFFVKRGQSVGDNVKVEAIFKDHVVVNYEDREYELR